MKGRINVVEETIEGNKVETSERLDSLKETIEETKVSNNERFDSIEETLEKDGEKLSKTENDLKAQSEVNKDEIIKVIKVQ